MKMTIGTGVGMPMRLSRSTIIVGVEQHRLSVGQIDALHGRCQSAPDVYSYIIDNVGKRGDAQPGELIEQRFLPATWLRSLCVTRGR